MKAKREDKNLIITLLVDSFKDNQSVNYIVKQDNYRLKRIRALMDYSFELCFLFGEVFIAEDHHACALILLPQNKTTTLFTIWLDIKLIVKAITIGGILKALRRESQIKKIQPKQNMVYLWFIGVDSLEQQKGLGSRLLQEILEMAKSMQLPVFLETSTLKNLPWYERFGFEIYNSLELGYKLFFLKKVFDTK